MQHVARCARDFAGLEVNFARYRRLQVLASLIAGKGWLPSSGPGERLWSSLTLRERLWAVAAAAPLLLGRILGVEIRVGQVLEHFVGLTGFIPVQVILDRGRFSRLIQVFDAIQGGAFEAPIARESTVD